MAEHHPDTDTTEEHTVTETTAPEARTYTTHVVVWRRGPLDKPELVNETANYFPTADRALAFEVGVVSSERLVATAAIERTLIVGQDVEVSAFGRMRAGVVMGFTRTKVVVDFVRNGNGDIETGRRFAPEAVYEADEATMVEAVKVAVATELAVARVAQGANTAGRIVTPHATCNAGHDHISRYAADVCDREPELVVELDTDKGDELPGAPVKVGDLVSYGGPGNTYRVARVWKLSHATAVRCAWPEPDAAYKVRIEELAPAAPGFRPGSASVPAFDVTPVVEPELAAGLGILTEQLREAAATSPSKAVG